MRTASEMEAAVSDGMRRFQREFIGRSPPLPPNIQCHLIGELVVVRMQCVLTLAEQNLVKTTSGGKGCALLKKARTLLIEAAYPKMAALIARTTGEKVVSMHHDLSTRTGEEVVLFTLGGVPHTLAVKSK